MDNWAASASTTSVDTFRVDAAGSLRTAHFQAGGGWGVWSQAGTSQFSAHQQVCAVAYNGAVHAFVAGRMGVHHIFRSPTLHAWQESLVPHFAPDGALAAAAPLGAPLMLFAQSGAQGAVVATALGPGGWSTPAVVGHPHAAFAGSLSVAVHPGGQVHLTTWDEKAGLVNHAALPSGTAFSEAVWEQVAALYVQGPPSVVTRTATSVDFVSLDPFAITVSDREIAGGAWSAQQLSDQEADSQPAKGVALGAKSVAVIGYGEVVDGSGIIVSRVTIDAAGKAAWGPWQLVPGDPHWNGTEICPVLRDGRWLHLFVNYGDGTLTAMCDTAAPHWSWSAWAPIKLGFHGPG